MKVKIICLLLLLTFLVMGCNNGVMAEVKIKESKFTIVHKIYRTELQVISNDSGVNEEVTVFGAGDNRDSFRPAVCAPYCDPVTWYMAFSRFGKSTSRFTFVVLDVPRRCTVYTVENPKFSARNTGVRKGSGTASVQQYSWVDGKLQPISDASPQTAELEFVIYNRPFSYCFLPLTPPCTAQKLIGYSPQPEDENKGRK